MSRRGENSNRKSEKKMVMLSEGEKENHGN